MLRDLAPAGVQGVGYVGEKSLIVVTKGVRAMVSTDWSGSLIRVSGSDLSLGPASSVFAAFLGLELKQNGGLDVISSSTETLSLWSTDLRLCS